MLKSQTHDEWIHHLKMSHARGTPQNHCSIVIQYYVISHSPCGAWPQLQSRHVLSVPRHFGVRFGPVQGWLLPLQHQQCQHQHRNHDVFGWQNKQKGQTSRFLDDFPNVFFTTFFPASSVMSFLSCTSVASPNQADTSSLEMRQPCRLRFPSKLTSGFCSTWPITIYWVSLFHILSKCMKQLMDHH